MAFEFKKLSDVEVVAEPTESANILIEDNGVIKKAPKNAIGGAGGTTGGAAIITYTVDGNSVYLDGESVNFYDMLEAWESGAILRVKIVNDYDDPLYGTVLGFEIAHTDDGDGFIVYYTEYGSIKSISWWN